MLTGYLATLPQDALLSAGVLFYAKTGVATRIGVTEGAPDFDPASDLGEIMFDNRAASRLKGLSRVTGFQPLIKGTLKEFGPAASGNQIAIIEPGETEAAPDGSGTKVVTPRSASSLFAVGDYLVDFRWVFERASGGFAAIYAPLAIVRKWSMKGNDKKEAQISFEIEAVGDPVNDLSTAPYTIELRTALPSFVDELTFLRANLLGGDSAVAAWYSAAFNVAVDGSNNVTGWGDARGSVGFGPTLPPRDTSGPALSAGTTATRTLNTGNVQALRGSPNALFDVSTPKSVVYVGTTGGGAAGCPVGIYDDSARMLAIDEAWSTNHGYADAVWFSPGPSLVQSFLSTSPSVRALSNKKRLIVAAQNGTVVAANCPPLVEVTAAISAQTAGNLKGMVGNVTNAYVVESVRAFLVLNRKATTADVTVLRQWAALYHSAVNGPANALYAAEGDSISAGFGLNTIDQGWPNVAFNTAATPMLAADDANFAVSGSFVADLVARQATVDALFASVGGKKFLTVVVGTNNVAHDSPFNQSTFMSALWGYIDARKLASPGLKVAVGKVIPLKWNAGNAPADQATQDALIAGVNAAIASGWASHADALIDFTLDAPFSSAGGWSNLTYYQADGAHPTQAGAAIMAARAAGVLATL